jgi:dTDP-glucose pyrophosphorylase
MRVNGKTKLVEAEMVRRQAARALKREYVIQPPDYPKYGTAIPPYLVRDHLKGEKAFGIVGGDDFFLTEDERSVLIGAGETLRSSGADHVILGKQVPRSSSHLYGMLEVANDRLVSIDEQPPTRDDMPPIILVNVSRVLVSSKFLDAIVEYVEGDGPRTSKEYRITDVINNAAASGQSFAVHPLDAEYVDCGTPRGVLAASKRLTEIYDAKLKS